MPIIRSIFCRLLPKSKWEWALYFFVLCCALRPWILGWILYPHDPASIRTFYRSPEGDTEYFPLINSVGRGNFGESAIYESRGSGIQTFPLASAMFHSAGVALFGSLFGFIAADIVVTFIFFLLLRAWCRLFSSDELWTSFLAALYVTGLPGILDGIGFGFFHVGGLWGYRIPRPFVSEAYLLAGMVLLVSMAWKPSIRGKGLSWVLLGVVFALCLQSSFYMLPPLGLAAAYLTTKWILEDRRAFPLVLARVGYTALSFLVLILPFIYQRLYESPDGMKRVGLFPVDRWLIWFHTPWYADFPVLVGLALIAALAFISAKIRIPSSPVIPSSVLVILIIMVLASFLAIPLSATITGKLVQPLHFFAVTGALQTSLLIAVLAMIGPLLLPRKVRHPLFAVVLLLFGFCLIPYHVVHRHILAGPLPWGDFSEPPGPDYHHALTALARELDRDIYRDDQVVATTDIQVYIYWVSFRGRYVFFPDASFTTLSNFEIENRLLWFAREEQLNKADFWRFLSDNTTDYYWLGGALYQFAPVYHKEPLEDYLPEEVAYYRKMPIDLTNPFHLVLPQSKVRELDARYTEILAKDEKDKPRLDLIILNKNARLFALPDPDPKRYSLTYHDDYFRVWKAIKPVLQGGN